MFPQLRLFEPVSFEHFDHQMVHSPRHMFRLHLLFALSGAAGLGLQLTWMRRLAFGLGHEVPATFGVVTTFFLGLSLGAWAVETVWKRPANPARVCAVLEWIIGLWAIGTVWSIPWLVGEASKLVSATAGWRTQWLMSFLVPSVALFPATVAMGATLPAIERWTSRLRDDGARVAPLYAANTLGAMVGVIAAVWWLQPKFGLTGSTWIFAAGNLICGAGCFWLGRGALTTSGNTRIAAPSLEVPVRSANAIADRRLLGTLFCTGLLGIGLEVLAVRLLSQALENTVYTYASVLAVYLFGTAAGAACRNRWFSRLESELELGLVALAGTCTLSGFALLKTPDWHPIVRSVLGEGPLAVIGAEVAMASLVLGLPTFFMGVVFSTLAQSAKDRWNRLGLAVAWNTFGAMLAPAVVGLGLLPWTGSHWTWVALSAGYLCLLPRFQGPIRWGVVAVLALLSLLPWELHLQRVPKGARLLSVREGPGDTITVVEFADKNRALRANNRFTMGGTASASAERRHGLIPLLLHPAPRRALFLGVGTGISFASLDSQPGLEADGVELVPEIVEALDEFAPHNSFGSELKVRVADARRFVRSSKTHYDVIIADLFHPARDGAGGLYTREHFRAVRSRLETNGVFCQWLPLFQLDLPTLRSITRTFLDVFPHTEAFLLRFNADTPVLGLVGSRNALQFDSGWFERRTQDPRLREYLKPLLLNDSFQLFGTWFAGAEWLKQLSEGAALNTDEFPVVVFRAPQTLVGKPRPGHDLLQTLLARSRPGPEALFTESTREAARPWLERVQRFQQARDVYLGGLIAESQGAFAAAETAFVASATLSADFTSGYSQILTRAAAQAAANPAAARRLLEQLIQARPERSVARELKSRLGL